MSITPNMLTVPTPKQSCVWFSQTGYIIQYKTNCDNFSFLVGINIISKTIKHKVVIGPAGSIAICKLNRFSYLWKTFHNKRAVCVAQNGNNFGDSLDILFRIQVWVATSNPVLIPFFILQKNSIL